MANELCEHQKTVCPKHNGAFDCNPFCDFCEGEGEYCRICNALEIVLADLEHNNAHTLGLMLDYQFNGALDPVKDELMYRTYLVAKNYLYSGDIEILGRK